MPTQPPLTLKRACVTGNPAGAFRFEDLTRAPQVAAAPAQIRGQRAMPALIEPGEQPAVPAGAPGQGEPLVRVDAPRVRDLAAYWNTGWTDALPQTWVRVGVAAALRDVAAALPAGFGLALFDGWRSLDLQQALHCAAYSDPTLPPGFVAPPSADPGTPPAHLTGGTVDLTLTWHAQPLALGTTFDAFTPLAHTDAFETRPGQVRDLRRLLFWAMREHGFIALDCEWWHFELGTRRWAAVTGQPVLYGPATTPI